MIAVIADDFTGAAELGGLGLRFGLKVLVETEVMVNGDVDLLIIATNTRSDSEEEAAKEVYNITQQLIAIGVDWIYKKTDSVLRGHVLAELLAMIKASKKQKVLLVPANPTHGRTISNGVYYIDNTLLHKTGFSDDPEFPLKTSNVLELLGKADSIKVEVLKNNAQIPERGIIIGEATRNDDLMIWAKKVDSSFIIAGSSDFFLALLEANGYQEKIPIPNDFKSSGENILYVFGSSFSVSRDTLKDASDRGCYVSMMPHNVFTSGENSVELLFNWSQDIIKAFSKHSKVIIAINQPMIRNPKVAKRLRESIAIVIERVLNEIDVNELYVEGGATVFAILSKIKFNKLIPTHELAPGVIRFLVQDKSKFYLTIKPGSYLWPDSIW